MRLGGERRFHILPSFFFAPETATLTLDSDMLKKLESLNFFLALTIILHEFFHALVLLLKETPGLILNLLKLRNESIVDLIKSDENKIMRIKEKIVKREIICNDLYLNSYEIFEALCCFYLKNLKTEYFLVPLGETLKKHARKLFNRKRPWLRRRIFKILKKYDIGISSRLMSKLENLLCRKIEEDTVKDFKEGFTAVIDSFIEVALDTDKKEKIFSELEWLASQSSPGFAELVCLMALDIPPISLEKIAKLDMQFIPQKRFNILIKRLKELNKKTPLKEIEISDSKGDARKNAMKFLSKLTGLERYGDNDRKKIIRQIYTSTLKLRIGRMKDPLKQGFKYGIEAKNIIELLSLLTRKIQIPVVLIMNKKERLITERLKNSWWEVWIYENIIISDVARNNRPSSKVYRYVSRLPLEKRKKMERLLEIAEKAINIRVSRQLVRRLETSDLKIMKIYSGKNLFKIPRCKET